MLSEGNLQRRTKGERSLLEDPTACLDSAILTLHTYIYMMGRVFTQSR